MSYQEFGAVFPEIAAKETRSVTLQHPCEGIPAGTYSFLEMFCTDPSCDCRRAMIRVVNENAKTEAFLSYGWENRQFYVDWMGSDEMIDDIPGINVYPMQQQGPYYLEILKLFQHVIQADPSYATRIQKHYQISKKHQLEEVSTGSKVPVSIKTGKKIGRNDPCPCGSGKKAKKCCLFATA